MVRLILILQLVSTLLMTGVIWVVQLIQYPLFSSIGTENFTRYHDDYRFWITPIVAPAMLVELFSGVLLLFYPPENVDPKLLWLGLGLLALIWASTFFLQVPLHERLAGGFDPGAQQALVKTNWLRTAGWSLRGVLMIYLLSKTLRQ